MDASKLRACFAVALSTFVLMPAGCNTAPDIDEEIEETGVLRIPGNIPAAPEGFFAVAGDRFYLFVPAGWQTDPLKFDESNLLEWNSCELLDGSWNEAQADSTGIGGDLAITLFSSTPVPFAQMANNIAEQWKKTPYTTVTHVESSPITLANGTSAHLFVMEVQTEHKQLTELMEISGSHDLHVVLFASDDPASHWYVSYQVSSETETELVHYDSELGKALVESVKSLVIVPEAAGSPAAPR